MTTHWAAIGVEVAMARAIWTGTMAFGLVSVPVGLFSATQQKDVRFNQFEEGTNRRVRYKRVAEGTDEEVPYEKIVKGYQLDSGEYVMLTTEELESVEPGRSRTIEITDFVELSEIDPIYFEKSYYLGPQGEGAQRAYALLMRAMRESGLAAIATFVMRTKQYLAVIRAREDVLVLETLFFPDEVREPRKVLDTLPEAAEVGRRELDTAMSLIEQLTVAWEPERYRDAYRERVLDLIASKAKGERIEAAPAAAEPTGAVDLMDALRRSVEAARGRRAGAEGEAVGETGERATSKRQRRKKGEDLSELSKRELMERAQKLGVSGRSSMSRADLEEAVRKAS